MVKNLSSNAGDAESIPGWETKIPHAAAMNMNLGKLREMGRTKRPGMLQSMGLQKVRHDWATEQYNNNTLIKLKAIGKCNEISELERF